MDSRGRVWPSALAGLAVAVVLLPVTTFPALLPAVFAYDSFTGCALECNGTRSPVAGTVFTLLAVLVAVVPAALAGWGVGRAWRHGERVVLPAVLGLTVVLLIFSEIFLSGPVSFSLSLR